MYHLLQDLKNLLPGGGVDRELSDVYDNPLGHSGLANVSALRLELERRSTIELTYVCQHCLSFIDISNYVDHKGGRYLAQTFI